MHDDVKRRIVKLLKQAESVAGTPEAEAFTDKAMALIAEYGITEINRQLSNPRDPRAIVMDEITFTGNIASGLTTVMYCIGKALHCAVMSLTATSGRPHHKCEVHGVAVHVERATLLMEYLRPQVRAALQRDLNAYTGTLKFDEYSENWHWGFGLSIRDRLAALESQAMETLTEDHKGAELVLASDLERAVEAMNDRRKVVIRAKSTREIKSEFTNEDLSTFFAGVRAGENADLMQSRIDP